MSARLFSLALDADVPSRACKLILVKLVDCCDDDGRRIYPSVATLARAGACSERTVQRVLGQFCAAGLLARVRAGGMGPKSTATYELNVRLLERLTRESWAGLTGGFDLKQGLEYAPDAYQADGEPALAAPIKGDTMSPLEPVRVTNAPDKGDNECHPTPQEEPLNLERESAGAGGREDPPHPETAMPDAQDAERDGVSAGRVTPLAAFLKVWPTAAVDSRARIEAAWSELPFAERSRAVKSVPAYLELAKSLKRGMVPAGFTYLAERRWTLLSGMAAARDAGKPVALPAWGKGWWALLLARIERGEPCGLMLRQAAENKPWAAAGRDLADDEALAGLKGFPSDGDVATRWAQWLAGKGLALPAFEKQVWLWLPGPFPPGWQERLDRDVAL